MTNYVTVFASVVCLYFAVLIVFFKQHFSEVSNYFHVFLS